MAIAPTATQLPIFKLDLLKPNMTSCKSIFVVNLSTYYLLLIT